MDPKREVVLIDEQRDGSFEDNTTKVVRHERTRDGRIGVVFDGRPRSGPPKTYSYPAHRVRAFLVWTAGPLVRELTEDEMDAALAQVKAA